MSSLRAVTKGAIIRTFDLLGNLYQADGIPIFCYHSIDDSGSLLSVSPGLFSDQMDFLARRGYRTLLLSELCELLRGGGDLPPKRVVLTFDDGFRNNLTEALPILQRHGFTATLFVATGYTGIQMGWIRTPDVPQLEMASWEEIGEMAKGGFEIGAHSINHPNLCQLSAEEIRQEIEGSKREIEEQTGYPVTLFAYPYGEFNAEIQALVRESGLSAAVTLIDGRTRAGDDLTRLKRVNITGISRVSEATKLAYFRSCVMGSASWYTNLKERFPKIVNTATPWRNDGPTP